MSNEKATKIDRLKGSIEDKIEKIDQIEQALKANEIRSHALADINSSLTLDILALELELAIFKFQSEQLNIWIRNNKRGQTALTKIINRFEDEYTSSSIFYEQASTAIGVICYDAKTFDELQTDSANSENEITLMMCEELDSYRLANARLQARQGSGKIELLNKCIAAQTQTLSTTYEQLECLDLALERTGYNAVYGINAGRINGNSNNNNKNNSNNDSSSNGKNSNNNGNYNNSSNNSNYSKGNRNNKSRY